MKHPRGCGRRRARPGERSLSPRRLPSGSCPLSAGAIELRPSCGWGVADTPGRCCGNPKLCWVPRRSLFQGALLLVWPESHPGGTRSACPRCCAHPARRAVRFGTKSAPALVRSCTVSLPAPRSAPPPGSAFALSLIPRPEESSPLPGSGGFRGSAPPGHPRRGTDNRAPLRPPRGTARGPGLQPCPARGPRTFPTRGRLVLRLSGDKPRRAGAQGSHRPRTPPLCCGAELQSTELPLPPAGPALRFGSRPRMSSTAPPGAGRASYPADE